LIDARARLESVFRAALAAVEPGAAVRRHLDRHGTRLAIAGRELAAEAKLVVIAAGKAASAMAGAVEELAGDRIGAGLAVTKDGHARPLTRIEVRETAHPVPDARCERAARALLALAERTRPEDVALVLLSGGASALLACPQPGLDAADVAQTTALLLAAGADIRELNTVRKHLVEVAGGRLAQALRTHRIEVLVVSDVIGDPLDVIASGPCTPDPTRFADALAVIARRGLATEVPARARAYLQAGARGDRPESPKPGDAAFTRVRTHVVARLADALAAAEIAARMQGFVPLRVGDEIRGEAREAGRRLAALAIALRPPTLSCLIAGGETTVTLRGDGQGGRNQELALAAALAWRGVRGVSLLAAGTDGSDGPTDAAGAFVDGDTVGRGAARGVDAATALACNDSHGFFAREGGVFRTGPTGTNVMDVVLMAVDPNVALPAASESV
jgi:hydroxypyruvate reductase